MSKRNEMLTPQGRESTGTVVDITDR